MKSNSVALRLLSLHYLLQWLGALASWWCISAREIIDNDASLLRGLEDPRLQLGELSGSMMIHFASLWVQWFIDLSGTDRFLTFPRRWLMRSISGRLRHKGRRDIQPTRSLDILSYRLGHCFLGAHCLSSIILPPIRHITILLLFAFRTPILPERA